jgi:osmotically-inducible protein OsmY
MGVPDQLGHVGDVALAPRPTRSVGVVEGAETRLRGNSYLALKNVSCEYFEGVLTLRGCVPSYYLKQMAQTAVARLDGVDRIVNEIEVISAPRR